MHCVNRAILSLALLLATARTAPLTEPPAAQLGESLWTMTDASFAMPDGVKPTLELRQGRILLAHSGCNRASGPYQDLAGRLQSSLVTSAAALSVHAQRRSSPGAGASAEARVGFAPKQGIELGQHVLIRGAAVYSR